MTKEEKAAYDKKRYAERRDEYRERAKAHYLANREARIEAVKQWTQSNRELSRGYKQAWKKRNPLHARSTHTRALYGISAEEERRMHDEQNGACAICGTVAPLCIDHCHDSGKVRGLLCRICNTSLGGFVDAPELLVNALAYLEQSGTAKPFTGRGRPIAEAADEDVPEQLSLLEASA